MDWTVFAYVCIYSCSLAEANRADEQRDEIGGDVKCSR